jgi:hypothetical protein
VAFWPGRTPGALVLASPRDLTAGWSYTALSRARGETRLLVYDDQFSKERSEFAPAEETATATRADLLARVERRMLERDDEDLAIEQLPAVGRADDPDLAGARALAAEPPQEHAAARAEPHTPRPPRDPSRLRELRERVEQLQAQLAALPSRQLQRIEDLDSRAITLSSQREQLAERLAGLPEPRRRLGRQQDPHAVERTHLASALAGSDRELDGILTQRSRLQRELGNPAEISSERDGLQHALTQSTREHTEIRNELAERELHTPAGTWVEDTFGERPDERRPREVWENGVRQAARYRAQYDITDTDDALGPRPESREQQRDWERAREALERSARRLGRAPETKREIDLGIGF